MPRERDRSRFQDIINTLANAYDAPAVEPHVTIYVGDLALNESPGELIQKATAGAQTVRLQIRNIGYTDEFTKTLFLQFRPSRRLGELTEALRRYSASPSDYVLNPHLSLIYRSMSLKEKQKAAASVVIPHSLIYFDEVWAIATPPFVRDRQDVESWRVLYRKKLGGEESAA